MKKCPKCAEDIKAEAIVCKHCGSDLSDAGEKSKRMRDFVSYFQRNTVGFSESYFDADAGIVKLVGPKAGFSFLWFLLFFGLLYLVYHWQKKPCFITIRFDDKGFPASVISSFGDYSSIAKRYLKENGANGGLKSISTNPFMNLSPTMAFLLILLVVVILSMIGQASMRDYQTAQTQQNTSR